MATLIPETPSGLTTPVVARLFRTLRKLPDDYTVWHSFEPEHPHFLILSPEQNAFLIHVAETTEELAQSALQLNLLESAQVLTPDSLGASEVALLDNYPLAPETRVRRLLIFPNAHQNTLDQVFLQRSKETEVSFLGLHQTSPEEFISQLQHLATAPLPELELFTLRQSFSPETVIPVQNRPTLIEREKAAEALPSFLDLNQEKLFKQDLLLPPPGETVSATSRLVTGPAGSGKSLVLLHRALLAAKLHPGARLLVLTHNKPVNAQLRERFQQIAPDKVSVEWQTFFGWAAKFLPRSADILPDYKSRRRIASLQANDPQLASFQPEFLSDEINYLRDLGIDTLEDYLALERTGRLTGLQSTAREAIWKLLQDYRAGLTREGLLDWHERALQFYSLSSEKNGQLRPEYDFIFIDEAQFFAKIWFAPVLAALKNNGQLFLSADKTQGFLKRRQTWRDLGIDVQGRSHPLRRVYRSTRQIAMAARQFFLNRHSEIATDDPTEVPDLLNLEDIAALPDGEQVHCMNTSPPEKVIRVIERQLDRTPQLKGHILVIEADALKASSLKDKLESHFGHGTVKNLQASRWDPEPTDPICQVSSLHAATGVEFTSVILLGLDSLLESENNPLLTPESAAELRAIHTRLIYVGLTRAIARLSIISHQPELWQKMLALPPESGSAADEGPH